MANKLGTLMGLNSNEAHEIIGSKQVDRETFEAMQVFFDVTFGPLGLVETVGSTWDMVNDPRFERIEAEFVTSKPGLLGGIVHEGAKEYDEQGYRGVSVSSLKEYSLLLSEGRNYLKVLAAKNIDPFTFHEAESETIWDIIREESPNWFFRKGKPNPLAERVYRLIRLDLVGLVASYAASPNIDEWYIVESNGELVPEAQKNNIETQQIYAEIQHLADALNNRENLRTFAAILMKELRIDQMANVMEIQLTEEERDHILKLLYKAKWPDDRLNMVTAITSYMAGLKFLGSFEYRQSVQIAKAKERAEAFNEEIRTGKRQPISRHTEGVVASSSDNLTDDQVALLEVRSNPLKQLLLVLLVDSEKAKAYAEAERAKLLAPPEEAEATTIVRSNPMSTLIAQQEDIIATKQAVIDVLTPVFDDPMYFVDDAVFRHIMGKVYDADPKGTEAAVNAAEATTTNEEVA